MELLTINILYCILFTVYAGLNGITEAILYSGKGSKAFKINEHIIFRSKDALVYAMVLVSMFTTVWYADVQRLSLWNVIILLINYTILMFSNTLAFSLWHNWAYYWARKRIDQPNIENPFKYQSDTSTAKNDFNYVERRNMAIVGGLILTAWMVVGFL